MSNSLQLLFILQNCQKTFLQADKSYMRHVMKKHHVIIHKVVVAFLAKVLLGQEVFFAHLFALDFFPCISHAHLHYFFLRLLPDGWKKVVPD